MASSSGPVWGREPREPAGGPPGQHHEPPAPPPGPAPLPPVVPYHPPQGPRKKRRFGLRGPGELTGPVVARLCLIAVLGVIAMFVGEEDQVLVTAAGVILLLSAIVYFFFRV